jgi:hypothetical protein
MRWATRLLAFVLLVAACSPSSQPATTPGTVPTTTTTVDATTTTVDRIAEIEAIYQDLEERRLDALYRGDREAFRALFANEAYAEASMGAFDAVSFVAAPEVVVVSVSEILRDDAQCLAIRVNLDESQSLGEAARGEVLDVLQPMADGAWGFSYSGEEWLCEGPHPLSS